MRWCQNIFYFPAFCFIWRDPISSISLHFVYSNGKRDMQTILLERQFLVLVIFYATPFHSKKKKKNKKKTLPEKEEVVD